jgi:hypothetical protein
VMEWTLRSLLYTVDSRLRMAYIDLGRGIGPPGSVRRHPDLAIELQEDYRL